MCCRFFQRSKGMVHDDEDIEVLIEEQQQAEEGELRVGPVRLRRT